ncbi:MAG: hypothetical protein CFH01_01687 [Alphaproteobacteria bacterium MarineAlpha2_Bin1]|nr:MAG: hypothetical protein CFH01_01687 [Alphaproteobacteria bacterium MarineAlpha2_Bin1]
MVNRLKSKIIIKACIKIADHNSLPISILKKGDDERGTILLRIINRDNKSLFFRSKFELNINLDWQIAGRDNLLDLLESNEFIEKEKKIDTDIWIIEIEKYSEDIDIIKLFDFNNFSLD